MYENIYIQNLISPKCPKCPPLQLVTLPNSLVWKASPFLAFFSNIPDNLVNLVYLCAP